MNTADIKNMVAQRVYEIADTVDWTHLTIPQRQRYYEDWTNSPLIGGVLSQVMPSSSIRVYLKDTIIRSYSRSQRLAIQSLLVSMSIPYVHITQEFIKPQAVLCDKIRLYTLAAAREWKIAIMSAFERSSEIGKLKRNLVFFTEHTTGRFVDKEYRDLIESAARRLDIEIQWLI